MKRATVIWLVVGGLAVVVLSTCSISLMQSLDGATKAVLETADAAADEFEKSGITMPVFQEFATPQYYSTLVSGGPAAIEKFAMLGEVESIAACALLDLRITNGEGASRAACKSTFDRGQATLIMTFYMPVGGAWKISGLAIQI